MKDMLTELLTKTVPRSDAMKAITVAGISEPNKKELDTQKTIKASTSPLELQQHS